MSTTNGGAMGGGVTARVNIPGRVVGFYEGGGAYQAWERRNTASRDYPDGGELELFEAVAAGKRRYAKGGYWVSVELSAAGIEAARYWAETLEAASDDGRGFDPDPDARNDLRAAERLLARLSRVSIEQEEE